MDQIPGDLVIRILPFVRYPVRPPIMLTSHSNRPVLLYEVPIKQLPPRSRRRLGAAGHRHVPLKPQEEAVAHHVVLDDVVRAPHPPLRRRHRRGRDVEFSVVLRVVLEEFIADEVEVVRGRADDGAAREGDVGEARVEEADGAAEGDVGELDGEAHVAEDGVCDEGGGAVEEGERGFKAVPACEDAVCTARQ